MSPRAVRRPRPRGPPKRRGEAAGEAGGHARAEARTEGRSAAALPPAAGAGLLVVDGSVERRGRRRTVGAHEVRTERRPVAVPAPLALTRTETGVVGSHGVSP